MSKAFTFYLLAFSFFLTACSPNPNLQGRGEDYLQGEWKQDSVPMQKQLLSYSLYRFKFTCDSVYMELSEYSKVNTGMDSCMLDGHWKEYIRGTYSQRDDTLHIRGNFCNADYTLKKQAGCFRSGPYEEYFKVNKKADSTVQFLSTSNVIPINLHLIKRTSCTPKPL
ncbi:fumarate hydratase [Mucilaginibacter panaciglaebae]|uniref:Fumarate hydratase n=1 Tax=Mucilaginibacter panaciglaebae TaxID=502331 RepID=A0ABP7WS29_9SPHI